MDFKEIESMVKLERLFPLYKHAVKEIFHEHTRVNGLRFRDAIILLGQNEATRHEIQMFAKEVNQKVIKVNSPTHVAHFAQLVAVIDGESKMPKKKVVEKPKKEVVQPKKKKVDSDEDVDDKPSKKTVVKSKKVDSDEDVDDKLVKKTVVKKVDSDKPKKKKTPSPTQSSEEEQFSSSPEMSDEKSEEPPKKKVVRRQKPVDEDELEL